MWEQYRDDAFADRGIEPRPPNVTGATVTGKKHRQIYRRLLFPSNFYFLHFIFCACLAILFLFFLILLWVFSFLIS